MTYAVAEFLGAKLRALCRRQRGRDLFDMLPSRAPRADRADAARLLVDRGEAGMLDAPTPTRFDEDEWEW